RRQADPQLAQGVFEPVEMRILVDHLAAVYGNDLVNAVGELITSVLDVNGGVGVMNVTAIDISESGHRNLKRTRALRQTSSPPSSQRRQRRRVRRDRAAAERCRRGV